MSDARAATTNSAGEFLFPFFVFILSGELSFDRTRKLKVLFEGRSISLWDWGARTLPINETLPMWLSARRCHGLGHNITTYHNQW